VDSKSKNIWGWLKFIVGKGVVFNWCENKIVRDFSKLKPISVETLQKYMGLLTEKLENKIREMLPEHFGIIIDGWSEGVNTSLLYLHVFLIKKWKIESIF
jgi:hypothetical protein